ncbi:MAG: hypothetical protein IKK77_05920 [Clostridia bacterium]|nr:hypothetical protein [Clostridia bacterium]
MKRLESFSIRELLYNKKFAVTFSIVTAFIIWLIISLYQTPEREQTFTNVPLTINTKGTVVEELGMGIVNDISDVEVSVTVYGPNYVVSSLNSDDLTVTASLSDVTEPGTYVLRLSPAKSNKREDYNLVNISPASITAKFDYIDTQEFDVTPQAEGVSAVSNLIAEAPVLSSTDDSKITIKGPRTEIKKIASVVAFKSVNKVLESTTSFDASIKLLDEDGNELDKTPFEIETETVKISVPISKKATFKLETTFTNAPSDDAKNNLNIKLDVDSITVIGPPNTIDGMQNVALSPIDYTQISKSNGKFNLTPVFPDGVKSLDNVEQIVAEINTSSLSERTFNISNVEFINKADSITTASATNIKNVKICGPSRVLRNLTEDDFKAVIDLKGKAKGEYTMNVTITCHSNPVVWQVGKYTVSVTLN